MLGVLPRDDNMCVNWVVVDGVKLRKRTVIERERYHDRGGRCSYGCGESGCVIDSGPDPDAEKVIRDWALCGRAERWCWPDVGMLNQQDSVTVFQFQLLDGLTRGSNKRSRLTA